MTTLIAIGERLLQRLVPQISAAGCCPADDHCECCLDGICGSLYTMWDCRYDCNCNLHCTYNGDCCASFGVCPTCSGE